MEVEEIQAQQPCKFPRIGNGGRGSSSVAKNPDEEDNNREIKTTNRLNGWHHSRIIRVSRASGGKDRHSKVWTSKGLRDRRVRLSVSTAIQFYDLQDRLGYDQPSKAVEWLIKSAADAIAELPSLNTASFPDTPKQLSDEKRGSSEHGFDSVELDVDDHPNYHHQMNQTQSQQLCLSKSACSSTSETSKGSGLSLSRPDTRVNRVKAARERARERRAKEKEKESNNNNNYNNDESSRIAQAISQNSSFTELLTGGIGHNSNNSPTGHHHHQNCNGDHVLFHKAAAHQQQMDYSFGSSSLLGLAPTPARNQHQFSGQIHLGNSLPAQTLFSISGDHHHHRSSSGSGHPEMQHFSFVPDYIPVSAAASGGDYNLNFSMSISKGSLPWSPMYLSSSEPPQLQPWRITNTTSSQLDCSSTVTEAGIQTTREKQRTDLFSEN
ncbi:hypothetical protein ACLB2K_033027 [Fragaria x ananassa]